MKVYLFNTETGAYLGEDYSSERTILKGKAETFEHDDILADEEGITPVPPPHFERGQVPIFDHQKNTWTVIPVTIARELFNL